MVYFAVNPFVCSPGKEYFHIEQLSDIDCLGRVPEFLNRLKDHAMGIFGSALVIGCTPHMLKPIPGIVASYVCKYLFDRASQLCLPLVKERMEHMAKLKADGTYNWSPPVKFSIISTLKDTNLFAV